MATRDGDGTLVVEPDDEEVDWELAFGISVAAEDGDGGLVTVTDVGEEVGLEVVFVDSVAA